MRERHRTWTMDLDEGMTKWERERERERIGWDMRKEESEGGLVGCLLRSIGGFGRRGYTVRRRLCSPASLILLEGGESDVSDRGPCRHGSRRAFHSIPLPAHTHTTDGLFEDSVQKANSELKANWSSAVIIRAL